MTILLSIENNDGYSANDLMVTTGNFNQFSIGINNLPNNPKNSHNEKFAYITLTRDEMAKLRESIDSALNAPVDTLIPFFNDSEIAVLDLLANNAPMTIYQLLRVIDIPMDNMYIALHELEDHGVLKYDARALTWAIAGYSHHKSNVDMESYIKATIVHDGQRMTTQIAPGVHAYVEHDVDVDEYTVNYHKSMLPSHCERRYASIEDLIYKMTVYAPLSAWNVVNFD